MDSRALRPSSKQEKHNSDPESHIYLLQKGCVVFLGIFWAEFINWGVFEKHTLYYYIPLYIFYTISNLGSIKFNVV